MGICVGRRCLAVNKCVESRMRLRQMPCCSLTLTQGQVRSAGTTGPAAGDAIDNPPLKLSKREKQRRREASDGNAVPNIGDSNGVTPFTSTPSHLSPPRVEKLRRVGDLVVPWHVKKRWLRHMKQHGLFLQWLAFIARRHYISSDPTQGTKARETTRIPADHNSDSTASTSRELNVSNEDSSAQRTPFEKACSRIVLNWGVPFMVDEEMKGGGGEHVAHLVGEGEKALLRSNMKENEVVVRRNTALLSPSQCSTVGRFVHGPAHITPFADLDVRDGTIAIDLLTGLPNIGNAADISGTRQLYDLKSLVGPSASAHVCSAPLSKEPFSFPFPWLPQISSARRVKSSTNTKGKEITTAGNGEEGEANGNSDDDIQTLCPLSSSAQFVAHVPTQSMWYTEKLCANLTTMIAEDKQKYLGNKEWGGYGPQMPAGESMAAALEKYTQQWCALTANVSPASTANTSLASALAEEPASTATFFHKQQLRTVRDLSLVLPSRPLRQELENFPQEHALCETAFEVISAWEGGGSLSTAALNRRRALALREDEDKEKYASEQLNDAQSSPQGSSNTSRSSASSCAEKGSAEKRTAASIHVIKDGEDDGFRNSISHSPLRWRPDVIIDVGGGNGTMPWLAGKRFGYGTTNVVNIERYVTANNIGFDGGRGPPSNDYSHGNSKCRVADKEEGPVEIPHTGCFTSQLGHWMQETVEGDPLVSGPASVGVTSFFAATATDTLESRKSCECCSESGESSTAIRAQRWCRFGADRWSPRELPYYRVVNKDIRDVNWAGDVRYRADKSVVITKHLCGAGVDHLLRSFELQQFFPRYLFINSCCHMKSSYGEYINTTYLNRVMGIYNEEVYKAVTSRTSWLRQWGDAVNTNAKVALLADQLQWQHNVGKCIEGLMDNGRVQWLRERGYSAVMVEHVPSAVTPRNKLLIARRHDGLLEGPH